MKYIFTILFLYSLSVLPAQQDALFSRYNFNSLTFNPAYAGSQDYLTINILNRAQWLGWNKGQDQSSGLSSQSLSAHLPFTDRVGLGVHFVGDAIGSRRSNKLNLAYAYRIPFGFGTLSVGLQAGLSTWQADWSKLSFQDSANDPAFYDTQVNSVLPNFGAGFYFQADNYYAGFSIPSLLQLPLPSEGNIDPGIDAIARSYRTYFFMAGGIFPILPNELSLKPSLLIRKTGFFTEALKDLSAQNDALAPSTLDIDCSAFLLELIWIGVGYRTSLANNAPLSVLNTSFAISLQNGMRLGLSYDYDLGAIRNYSNGSFELMLGYDFNYKVGRVQSPRYF